jgi:hypothetical protein
LFQSAKGFLKNSLFDHLCHSNVSQSEKAADCYSSVEESGFSAALVSSFSSCGGWCVATAVTSFRTTTNAPGSARHGDYQAVLAQQSEKQPS